MRTTKMERIALAVVSVMIGFLTSTLFWVSFLPASSTPIFDELSDKVVVEEVISVLEEKQKCDDWGGKFSSYTYDGIFAEDAGRKNTTITCIKYTSEPLKETTEYLFKYEF